jgi:acyl-CoA synthetase (AMP-forming)/AMP-acid ligase II
MNKGGTSSVPAAVLAKAAVLPDKVAIVDGDARITYAGLVDQIGQAANAMIAMGIQPGDRVVVWAPNSSRWIVAALATQAVGAAFVPINTRYKPAEAAYPIIQTKAKLLIADHSFMGLDALAALDLCELAERPRLIDLSASGGGSWQAFLAEGQDVPPDAWRETLDQIKPDDVCDVMFTSGSTGRPKAVPHKHGVTIRQTLATISQNGNVEADRYLVVNPFFHVFGYTGGWLPALLVGATVYPVPVFDTRQALQMVELEQITYFPGPPTIFLSILEHPDFAQFDVSSLRLSLTGAADVPVELIQRMLDELTFDRVVQAYGMTECGTATYTLAEDDPKTVATTIGVACEGFEVKIVDADNNDLNTNEPGEIVVRGYAVMDGYLDDPDATAATIDAGGWLHTGDRGAVDDTGHFRILGRIKDMVIVGGFNVYPAEVEDIMREHPGILDAAVIGVPDGRLGEVVCAFVTGVAADPEAITLWCRDHMANFKVPRFVVPLAVFPLTGSNKVSKVDLREMAGELKLGVPD